jgi:hypothetical protein
MILKYGCQPKNPNNEYMTILDKDDNHDDEEQSSSYKNIPISCSQNIPISLLGQCYDDDEDGSYRTRRSRRYTKAQHIERLAVEKYNKNGKGITFNDLLSERLVSHKEQAQITLKYCLQKNVLFTISNRKPQQYYPTCLKSEIIKNKQINNILVGVTEVPYSSNTPVFLHVNKSNNNDDTSTIIIDQTLEGYVLPLLPSAPLFIHKMQFKLRIIRECYKELELPVGKGNNVKEHAEVIGKVRVNYHFYPNGTVMVFTESSNNPFKLQDEADLSSLIAFFGQVRDRLVTFLADKHERIVPGLLEWELTQCDINKDIKVSEALQYTGIKIQVKHFDHLFRVYIKSLGKGTACRVEEALYPNKPAVQALSEIIDSHASAHIQQQPQQSLSSSSLSSAAEDCKIKINDIHRMVRALYNQHNCASAAATTTAVAAAITEPESQKTDEEDDKECQYYEPDDNHDD